MVRFRAAAAGLLAVAVVLVTCGATAPDHEASGPTIIYLVRHAEKTDEGSNAQLSDEGRRRADTLSWMLRDVSLDAVYSTDFDRTRHTVQPIARAKRLEITLYQPRSAEFAQQLKESVGQTLLVCGHSDTIPKLLAELGTPIKDMILPGYDDLFVVVITRASDGTRETALQRLHYPAVR